MAELLVRSTRIVTCESDGPKYGEHMQDAGVIETGYIAVSNGIIEAVGTGTGTEFIEKDTKVIDAGDKVILPGLVDPHTHLVHAGSRENELELKLKGMGYLEILKNGGGILSTVKATRAATFEELSQKVENSLDIMLQWGTTTVEAKSGYGLNLQDEVKSLRVLKEMNHSIDIVPTFMGAHAIPIEYKENRKEYIRLLKEEIIPQIAKESLAEYIDCFCEHGVFSIEESREILMCGKMHGMKIKIHADEIEDTGGASLAAELGAVSAEHLIATGEEGIIAMKKAGVIPILLPGTSFYLRIGKYAKAREMIQKGLPVALATDYNPGSCPTESLQSLMVFASMGMGLYPHEIINAMTINAAYAIGRGSDVGSIQKGKKADFIIMNAPNEHYVVYHFGINHVNTVVKNGKIVINGRR